MEGPGANVSTEVRAVRPLVPGVVVHYTLSDVQDAGVIVPITELPPALRENYYGDSHELTCLVRSEDRGRLVYHSILEKGISLATQDSLIGAPQTTTILSFLSLLSTGEICLEQVFGQHVLIYRPTYKKPSLCGTLGVPLSPMFLASINHSFTLRYLKTLALKLQKEPTLLCLRDLWRFLTLRDYDQELEEPDSKDTFTCRTPGVANYSTKGHDTLGNFIINEYSRCYNIHGVELSVGDICRVSGAPQPVRIDRILEMGPSGINSHAADQKIYIYGLTYLSDSRSTSDIVPCVYPLSLVEQLVSTNSAGFAEEFQIDVDVYDLWTLVTAEHIQEENHYIATIDMQTGFNFVSALDVHLSSNDAEITYATPIECSLCRYLYVQGNIYQVSTGERVTSWKHGRDGSVTIHESDPNSEPNPVSFFDLRTSYDMEQSIVTQEPWLYTAPCTYTYSKVTGRPLNELLKLAGRILERTSNIAVARQFQCCYCGKVLMGGDRIVGPFIYALVRCPTPLFLAQYVPPILFVAHHSCAFYTPEIAFLNAKDLKPEHARLLSEKRFDLIVTRHATGHQAPIPLIVQATALDRILRALLTEFSPQVYLNIRKTFKKNRIELICSICGKPGALIGCYNKTCQFTAHYPCVVSRGLIITEKREMYCKRHSRCSA
ncbi:Hypothetical protein GLP15_857 [Giardia lamblia P15]|uniref:PHD-type domain-containing protein n=1 Tax=Giardia intestinalis (strain P15) TaxID=658858 RepID=E1F3T9_GIAIA|nr:Hypothetical protein GLP15_857 [Giardia lamblia P15]